MRAFDQFWSDISRRLLAVVAAFVATILFFSVGAFADDDVFRARGKTYILDKSTTEFGVLLADQGEEGSVRREMTSLGIGALESPDGGSSRYRILRVGATNSQTRDLAATVPGLEWVRPVYRFHNTDAPVISTGQIVVRVIDTLAQDQVADMLSGYGVHVVRKYQGLGQTYIVAPDDDADGADIAAAVALFGDGRVEYAHPDFAMLAMPKQSTPQDNFFNIQWHLNNTGQNGATPGADIQVLDAWATTLGQDIRVGMLDDCCDVDHEDLRDNYIGVGQDIKEGGEDPRPKQVNDRHGTSVMGLIVASANSTGTRGVAPNASFTATRGLGFAENSAVASSYSFALQQQVDVHNNSWGFAPGTPVPDVIVDAIQAVFEDGRDGKGMVVLFATGNDGLELPSDLSGLPWVIAVGATNATDLRSSYSNFGAHVSVMGPSNQGNEANAILPGMITTDNTDDFGYAEPGYNFGGLNDFGLPNLSDPDYTDDFGGTSAATPVVSGVAALILSVNPELTATQVRVILEHTAEQVSPADADYNGVTSRSNSYGYGRVNAAAAVDAATDSLTNGNLTWPDRVSDVRVLASTLEWSLGSEAANVIVVRSDNVFVFTPDDEATYEMGETVAPGVIVDFKDTTGEAASFEFTPPDVGTTFFAIYTRNEFGRYSWGVLVDSDGNVTDSGRSDTGDITTTVDPGGIIPINEDPAVTIDVSPRSGKSPLTVSFQGNALTDSEVASSTWDFGDGSELVEDRDVEHTYEVNDGTTRTFVATFTVVDAEGDTGSRSIAISVSSDATDGGSNTGNVVVSITDESGDSVDAGSAPLDVRLSVNTQSLPGVFNSILWDLGDGETADTLDVLHTYNSAGTFAVTATIITCHATNGCRTTANPTGTTWQTTSPVEFISVSEPTGGVVVPPTNEDEDLANNFDTSSLSTGRSAGGAICGVGLMPLWLAMLGLGAVKRWNP